MPLVQMFLSSRVIPFGYAYLVVSLLLVAALGIWNCSRSPLSNLLDGDEQPKATILHVAPEIPVIGHLLGLLFNATAYVHRLVLKAARPIFSISILGKRVIVIVTPSPGIDNVLLARHVLRDMRLSTFAAMALGKPIFSLKDETIDLMARKDIRPLLQHEFMRHENGSSLLGSSLGYLGIALQNLGGQRLETKLDEWLFSLAVEATAHGLWGADNPWCGIDGFMEDFRIFEKTFESLYRPFPRLTARKAYQARHSLVSKFQAFQAQKRGNTAPNSVQHRLNIVAMEDPNWADNPDYYAIELIMALAILSTVGNITVWLIRHILADPAILQRILAQIDDLISRGDGMSVDLSNLHEACPLLVASWFETLRLHMTGTPRMVVHDFQLNTGERLRAGDIVLLPQSEPNRDPATWADPGRFSPDRFLDEQGRLVPSRTRKVKDFGVAGNLCPGRYFAFGLVMGLTVSVLATVDVQPSGDGGRWPEPRASTGVSGGFEQCVNDVAVCVTRKGKWVGQELPVSFARGLFRG